MQFCPSKEQILETEFHHKHAAPQKKFEYIVRVITAKRENLTLLASRFNKASALPLAVA